MNRAISYAILVAPVAALLLSGLHTDAEGSPPVVSIETDEEAALADSALPMKPIIEAQLDDGPFKKTARLDARKGQSVRLRVKAAPDAEVRWYLLFADLSRNYQNANHPWEPNPYRWTGFEPIRYVRIEIPEARNQPVIDPLAHLENARKRLVAGLNAQGAPPERRRFYHADAGAFRFQVVVSDNRGARRSAGLKEVGDRGISDKVFQLNLRESDSYIGILKSFYNVPGVFGSVLSQSRNRVGADCADILMAAWAEFRKKPLKKNYNVQMLLTEFRQTARARMSSGAPESPLRWGEAVREGDFIAVSYSETAKKFHHIGALLSDANGNGLLDAADTVIHAGPDPLHTDALSTGAFDGRIVILRHSR